jgi:hypothetical protein
MLKKFLKSRMLRRIVKFTVVLATIFKTLNTIVSLFMDFFDRDVVIPTIFRTLNTIVSFFKGFLDRD